MEGLLFSSCTAQKQQKMKIYVLILFCSFNLICTSQNIGSYLNKTLISKVGFTCMETSEPNPCAGNEIYAIVEIDKEFILISEKTISTCGGEEHKEIGRYKWKQIGNKVMIYYESKNSIYAKILLFKFKDTKIIGEIEYPNGKIEEKIFDQI